MILAVPAISVTLARVHALRKLARMPRELFETRVVSHSALFRIDTASRLASSLIKATRNDVGHLFLDVLFFLLKLPALEVAYFGICQFFREMSEKYVLTKLRKYIYVEEMEVNFYIRF